MEDDFVSGAPGVDVALATEVAAEDMAISLVAEEDIVVGRAVAVEVPAEVETEGRVIVTPCQ